MSELFFSSSRGFIPMWMFTGKRNPITINYIIIYAVILLTCVTNLWLFLCVCINWYQIEIKDPSRKRFVLYIFKEWHRTLPFSILHSFLAMIDCLNSIMCSHVYFMSMDNFLMHKKFLTLNFFFLFWEVEFFFDIHKVKTSILKY